MKFNRYMYMYMYVRIHVLSKYLSWWNNIVVQMVYTSISLLSTSDNPLLPLSCSNLPQKNSSCQHPFVHGMDVHASNHHSNTVV